MKAAIEGIYRDGKIIPKEALPWERPMKVVIVFTEPLDEEIVANEEYGWLRLSEDSLAEVWGDAAEDAVWRKYLKVHRLIARILKKDRALLRHRGIYEWRKR